MARWAEPSQSGLGQAPIGAGAPMGGRGVQGTVTPRPGAKSSFLVGCGRGRGPVGSSQGNFVQERSWRSDLQGGDLMVPRSCDHRF